MYQLTDKERSLVGNLTQDGRMDSWAVVHALAKTAYDTSPFHRGEFQNRRVIIMGICALELLCLANRGKSLYEMSESEFDSFRNDILSLVAALPSEEDFNEVGKSSPKEENDHKIN